VAIASVFDKVSGRTKCQKHSTKIRKLFNEFDIHLATHVIDVNSIVITTVVRTIIRTARATRARHIIATLFNVGIRFRFGFGIGLYVDINLYGTCLAIVPLRSWVVGASPDDEQENYYCDGVHADISLQISDDTPVDLLASLLPQVALILRVLPVLPAPLFVPSSR